jgi:hypothetical protein
MPQFYFTTIAADGTIRTGIPCEAADIDAASKEAKRELSRLAAEGLPDDPINMLSVEIYDEQQKPELELRLVLEEIRK